MKPEQLPYLPSCPFDCEQKEISALDLGADSTNVMATRAVVSLKFGRPHFSPRVTRPTRRYISPLTLHSRNISLRLHRQSTNHFILCAPFFDVSEQWHTCPTRHHRVLGDGFFARRRNMSTFASTEIQSTEELNEIIEQWTLKIDIDAQDFKKLLIWMETDLSIPPDAVTWGLLLDRAIRLKRDREGDSVVTILLENLLDLMASNGVAFGSTSLNILPPREIEQYMHMVMNRLVYRQPQLAHEWLERWWYHHEQKPDRISPPTPKAYELIMVGWTKAREYDLVLGLLQDMQSRDNVQAQVQHFEMCLNALVRAATKSKGRSKRMVAADAEAVLLQMSEWLHQYGSELAADGVVDSTGRSSQTRVLQNLTKVVHCWVDSRHKLAAFRATKILDLVDNIFRESDGVAADWTALVEAYSHAIRSWSFAATKRNESTRTALALEMENCDPTLQTEVVLIRLEDWIDGADEESLPIPLKTWRRIYGSAIAACCSEYDQDRSTENCLRARRLWDRFRDRGYGDPGLDLYNHLFHVYGKMGNTRLSRMLWLEMNDCEDQHVPDLKTFNWRLLAVKNSTVWLSELERLGEAKALWNQLRDSPSSPDTISYNTYLSCFITSLNDLTIAREGNALFHELLAHRDDPRCRANVASLNMVLRIWANLSRHSEITSEREEALRSALTILKEVFKLSSTGELRIQPTSLTIDLVTSLLDTNNIEEGKRAGVLRLLGVESTPGE